MMLTFVGVGPMRATSEQWQTNAVITHEEGGKKRHLLIDCGTSSEYALAEAGIDVADIDAVFITHEHGDHLGGLASLGLATYFDPTHAKLKVYTDAQLMPQLWERSLRGGMDTLEGKVVGMNDYFDCRPVPTNGSFCWPEDSKSGYIWFTPIQMLHVVAGNSFMPTFGLMITPSPLGSVGAYKYVLGGEGKKPIACDHRKRIFYTSDTQFCPHQIQCFYDQADQIFHDCETAPYYSKVHSHRDDLDGLDAATKEKMHFMHYQPVAPIEEMQVWAKEHGFAGFVVKGQEFDLAAL